MQCVALPLNLNIIHFLEEDMQTNNEKKKRSKAAKIVLWSLVGCVAAILITMLVWVIIAATGGTGTSNGGILGLGFNMVLHLGTSLSCPSLIFLVAHFNKMS